MVSVFIVYKELPRMRYTYTLAEPYENAKKSAPLAANRAVAITLSTSTKVSGFARVELNIGALRKVVWMQAPLVIPIYSRHEITTRLSRQ